MSKRNKKKKSDGKSLYSEKECHDLMARVCGKSSTEKNLDTFISGTTKTFRDVFVLTASLGAISDEPLINLPKASDKRIKTVNKSDIKIEHDNIMKAIAYWHMGSKEENEDSHKVLDNTKKFREIAEKYCYAGKETLEDHIKSSLFDDSIIKKILNI